jgi:thiol:disulfide interchange protein DsbD
MKRILAFIFLLSTCFAQAQVVNPVKWATSFAKKEVTVGSTIEVLISGKIDKGYYIYAADLDPNLGPLPTVIKFTPHASYELVGGLQFDTPKKKFDKIWDGEIKYHTEKVVFRQKIKVLSPNLQVAGTIGGQVCDEGTCVPFDEEFSLKDLVVKENPAQKENNSNNPTTTNVPTVTQDTAQTTTDSMPVATKDTTSRPAPAPTALALTPEVPAEESWWAFVLSAFLGGCLAFLTPCVYPMIPMTVAFFTKKAESRQKGLVQAFVYGASIIGIFTLIGVIFSLIFGADAANIIATHWLPNLLFFAIFMFFAVSFFGAFDIVLPHSFVNKIDAMSEKGGLIGVFFMAFTLVIVSFSCTGPIAGSLLVLSANGEIAKPIVGMVAYSAAFAIPFTFFALFPSMLQSLPKSGAWLNSVKVVLGFVEVALALKFLSTADQVYHWNLLPRQLFLAIWIVLTFLMGFYLLGKIRLPHDSPADKIGVGRLFLAILTFTFGVYLLPGMVGAPLKALSGFLPPQSSNEFDLTTLIVNNTATTSTTPQKTVKYGDKFKLPHGLQGYFDYQEALAAAKAQNKPLFIDFTGHGCVNCREIEANVWSSPEVLKRLRNNFIIVALYTDDITELPENEWIVSKYDGKTKKTIGKVNADFQITRFNKNSQPYYVILDHQEQLLTKPKAYDLNVDNFVAFLDEAKTAFESRK